MLVSLYTLDARVLLCGMKDVMSNEVSPLAHAGDPHQQGDRSDLSRVARC